MPRLLITSVIAAVLLVPPRVGVSSHSPWFGGDPKADVVNIQLPAKIKVSLLRGAKAATIAGTGAYAYTSAKLKKPVAFSSRAKLKIYGGKKGTSFGGKIMNATVRVAASDSDSHLTLNGRAYRGAFLIRPHGRTFDVIEEVGLEEYLNGVLPREVGADWPEESLKAQAVISRTFVVANLGRNAAKGYDVSSDVFSQVYGGLHDEQPASNKAVETTRGEILVDEKNAPVLTFFHSSCGGRTENPKYVWQDIQDPPAYLDSVKDTYCKDDPFTNWDFTISAESLQRRLRKAHYKGGPIKKVTVAKESPSGRAWTLDVASAKGHTTISGNAFRLAVGPEDLRSTLLSSIEKKGNSFHFSGHGWGHGVGLCQWGARGRAMEGHSYSKILDAYYPGVRLVKGVDSTHAEPVSNKP